MTVQITLVDILQGLGYPAYPLEVPNNGIYPNVVYQMISNKQIRSHSGVEMERPRMQISCWGKRYADCVTTAQTVKAALDLNQTDFKLATKENEFDVKEVKSGLYRIILDYFIWTDEA
jgi:hypothetical protein